MHGSSRLSAPGSTPPRPWCAVALSGACGVNRHTQPSLPPGGVCDLPYRRDRSRDFDTPGPTRRPVSRGGGDGHVRSDPLPGDICCAQPTDADHRQAAPHQPSDHEP